MLTSSLSNAKEEEKIGILYSYKNVETYDAQRAASFVSLWKSFFQLFEETNFNYQPICNISSDTQISDVDVDVIFFPYALDISPGEVEFLTKFHNEGGKLIIGAGPGKISEELSQFLDKVGIKVKESNISKGDISLSVKNTDLVLGLRPGDYYFRFDLSGIGKRGFASWNEIAGDAIGGVGNVIYIGYVWGQDVESQSDVKILMKVVDLYWKDIIPGLTKKITGKEFEKLVGEIILLKEQASSAVQIAEQLDLSVSKYQIRRHFEDAVDFFNDFNSDYLFGNYKEAREKAASAKNEFSYVYSLCIPSRKVEVRAVWLDRGTIVSCHSPNDLRKIIKNLANIGFNTIFFETINAGYPIYPSRLLPQNPLVKDWDPLKVAVEAAHAYGIELHAWVWTFAVGNTRHNILVDKSSEYAGPVISTKGRWWSLITNDGKLRVDMQPEFWVSPANKNATQFLQEIFLEIVQNYNIDGFQFDYIRFPFQKSYAQTGFDFVTKNAFKNATGKSPALDGKNNKAWIEWKTNLVSEFVRDTSIKIKKLKPLIKISVAVFAIERNQRLQLIQQDWESWLMNKWIDAAYPFYYSFTSEEMASKFKHTREVIKDKGIIIPSFNLRLLNPGELAERITESRNAGALGFALFAAGHLDAQKTILLQNGPFREKTVISLFSSPVKASEILLNEFSSIVEKISSNKNISVLSESHEQKEIYDLTGELKKDFENFSSDKVINIKGMLTELKLKVKSWLSLEKYLDRGQRAMYINSYLDQISILTNYINAQ